MKKIFPLFFRIDGPDLYVYKTENLTKVAFIIYLPVCEFSATEIDSLDDPCFDSEREKRYSLYLERTDSANQWAIKIKISEWHKRVFFVDNKNLVESLMQ